MHTSELLFLVFKYNTPEDRTVFGGIAVSVYLVINNLYVVCKINQF